MKGIALDPKNYTKSMENMANAMSDASLKQFALNQGIKVSYENMTQAQKSQLRYIALMTQVTVVQGDMARTLNSGANQIRIFQAQVTQATRALGTLFIPILNKVLPYLTAIATVVRDIATVIAKLFNIKLPTIDNSAWNQASESVENIGSGFKDATKQAKKFKATILGIDELNLMADNSGGEGTGTGDLGGYGGDLDFALPEYDFLKGATESRVSEITEKMKEWLGLTKEINSWTDLLKTRFGRILVIVGLIGGALIAWKIVTGITSFLDSLSKVKDTFDKLKDNKAFNAVFDFLKKHKKGVARTISIAVGFTLLIDSFVKALKEGVSGKTVLEAVGGGAMAGAGIGSFFGPMGTAIGAAVGAAVGAISQLVLFIYQNWDKITDWWNSDVAIIFNKKWWSDLFEPVVEWFKKVWEGIKLGFAVFLVLLFSPVAAVHKLSDKIVEWWNEKMAKYFTKKWWDEKFAPLKSKIDSLGNWFSESWDKVKEWFSSHVAPKFTKEYWSEKFKPLKEKIDSIGGWFSTAWGKVKSWFNSNVAPKFTAKFWQDKFDTIKTGFKNTINGLIGLLERGINFMVRNINKLHWDAPEWVQKEFGVTGLGFRFNEVKIPRLADGGQVNTGQMFIAREAGAELVGNVGRRTTVMNNEQIVEAVAMGVRDAILSTQSSDSGDITIVFNNEGGSVVEKIKRENLKAGKIIVPVYD